MTGHETALEAARKVYARTVMDSIDGKTPPVDSLDAAISAYLSTLSPDVSGLVERLRKVSSTLKEYGWGDVMVAPPKEAADALASLSLQLAAVEKKPLNLGITKEWFEKQAAKEGDLEIGAGSRKLTSTVNLTPDDMNELEKLAHEALPQWAQGKIASLSAQLARIWSDRPYIIGWNDGFEEASSAAQEENERLRKAVEAGDIIKAMAQAMADADGPDGPSYEHLARSAFLVIVDNVSVSREVHEALMDSQYVAGAKAGWNAAQLPNTEAQKKIAQLTRLEPGTLATLSTPSKEDKTDDQA